MNRILTLIVFFLVLVSSYAQVKFDSTAHKYAQTITQEDLKSHLEIISSDEYEGRETGEKGQKMAAEYISNYFKEWSLIPIGTDSSYFQKFTLYEKKYNEIIIRAGGIEGGGVAYKEWEDFVMFDRDYKQYNFENNELVFVGFGTEEDYSEKDVSNKSALLFNLSLYDDETRKKTIERAYQNGANFVLESSFSPFYSINVGERYKHYFEKGKLMFNKKKNDKLATINISSDMASKLMGISSKKLKKILSKSVKSGKPVASIPNRKISIKIDVNEKDINTENVVGLIEGSDKKDEIIVLSAHYDHIGEKGEVVYNGADDDGSGTVSILEMAEAFSKAKKEGYGPRRSILVIGMTGEEKGLLGSEYYSEHPIFPLEKTVCNLNTDMIGRVDTFHRDDTNYVYLIGTDMLSKELHNLSEDVQKTYSKLKLDYRFNTLDDPNQFYYRSDHYNFAKHGIPVIFYFTGVHEDYHQPTDTVDKIMFGKTENIARLIFYTAWEIANRENRIEVDVED